MTVNNKIYWKGIEQLRNDPEFIKNADNEFPEYLPIKEADGNYEESGTNRRDFLKLMGFGITAVTLAACDAPVKKAIPYLNKPEDIEPTVANFYASSYTEGGDYCSILIKTREGRPIFINGNKLSGVTFGGVNAKAQASVLSLYDKTRLTNPVKKGTEISWSDLDKEVIASLESAGQEIRIVSNTIISPVSKSAINEFLKKYPAAKHITYDANSCYASLAANEKSFGSYVLPSYDFSKAKTIVAISSDFLGASHSDIEFSNQYARSRKIGKNKKEMSQHFQFEPIMSLTGANADYRTLIKPSQEGLVVAELYAALTGQGSGKLKGIKNLDLAAKKLLANRGNSIVISGSKDVNVQIIINAINSFLGNYGNTIQMAVPSYQRQGNDIEMSNFIKESANGSIGAVIFYNCNPVYDHPMGNQLAKNLSNVKLKISTADRVDETASFVDYIAPDNHYLESWGDAEPKNGFYSLSQPGISKLFNTRQVSESLLAWSGNNTDIYTYLQNYWRTNLFPKQSKHNNFDLFWDKTLHNGVFEIANESKAEPNFNADISEALAQINNTYQAQSNEIELVAYEKLGVGTGRHANNPWLQEMPDPVTKVTWDNYLSISLSLAKSIGVDLGDMVILSVNGKEDIELPVVIQPGQQSETVAVAIGYGREKAGKVASQIGKNVYPLLSVNNGQVSFVQTKGVSIKKSSGKSEMGQTQTHHTYMGRSTVIQESILPKYVSDPSAGRFKVKIATPEGKKDPGQLTLWKIQDSTVHKYPNHHWTMVIDLNSCTGCSACTIACTSENNIPVVGKVEVARRRDMHWLRIDRYYSSSGEVGNYKSLEHAAEEPEVVFQPMLCQHCNNAPCETVCPVAATTHSSEGLNQMTYNRCVGTRYCANNCPYKVRRFNWFKYHDNKQFDMVNIAMNDDLGKMVLNPDVTVRSRGVIEKCSFCVQRIQEGKLNAKKQNRKVVDGEIVTACASACPTNAIMFGDINDPESAVFKLLEVEVAERAYHVLDDINTSPNIYYLTKIKNKDKEV